MTQRMYIIPIVHIDIGEGSFYNVPKYFRHRMNPDSLPELAGVNYAWETWLNEDVAIIVADVDDTQHTLVNGQADVVTIPPLDNTIPTVAVRNRVRTVLENNNIPGTWVIVGMAYRSIVRIVLGMFQFHNRVVRLIGRRLFDGTLNLTLTIADLSIPMQDALAQAAADLFLDYSAVTGATTLRQLLKGMGDQFANREFEIGGFII